jgi:peptide/nickel transport system substrate-binding protein
MVSLSASAGMAAAQTTSSSPTGSSSASNEVVFTYGSTGEPTGLNPLVGYTSQDYYQWMLTYDILINFGTKDFSPDFQHSIVTSVDSSTDGMTFTYHLRPGLKWSDGQPLTAADAAWTLNYYKKSQAYNFSADVALMKDAVAQDDTTLIIHSTVPTSVYSGRTVYLYDFILPEHIWAKYENDSKAASLFSDLPAVGSGPFVMTKYVKGQYVELDKNPYYWGNSVPGMKPTIDKVIYRIFDNEDAMAAGVANGELDFAYFQSANLLNTLKTKPGVTIRGSQVPSFDEIGLNAGAAYQTDPAGGFKPHGDGALALTDVRVRQAIRMAVDSKTLVDKVLQGYGVPAISPISPQSGGPWTPPSSAPDLSFNIANANTMLDQAGYTMGPNGVRIDPNNHKPLEFRYFTRTSDQNTVKTAPYVQAWLKEIGIKVDIQSVTSTKLENIIQAGNYEMFHWGWYPNPDPGSMLNDFTCAQRAPNPATYGNNDSYYCNPQYDQLYKDQMAATDPTKRFDIIHQMQDMLYTDQSYIMLYYSDALEAWRSDKWTGFQSQPGPNGDALAAYGPLSFVSIRPVTAGAGTASATASSGIPAVVWLAVAVAILLVVLAVVLMRRRHVSDEDRA